MLIIIIIIVPTDTRFTYCPYPVDRVGDLKVSLVIHLYPNGFSLGSSTLGDQVSSKRTFKNAHKLCRESLIHMIVLQVNLCAQLITSDCHRTLWNCWTKCHATIMMVRKCYRIKFLKASPLFA